jgi:hypothetical protein
MVTTSANRIMRREVRQPTTTATWREIPTATGGPGRAVDIAEDGNGYIWVVGIDSRFWLYEEQSCVGQNLLPCPGGPNGTLPAGDNGASRRQQWVQMFEGAGQRIAAGIGGITVVGTESQVWTTAR